MKPFATTAQRQAGWLALSLIALAGTWYQILDYLALPFLDAQLQFWRDTLGDAAGRFATIDLLFIVLAVCVWMVAEARRLGLRFVWAYIVYGVVIAFSSALPLFMLMRERALARAAGADAPLGLGDRIGLGALALFALGYLLVATLRADA